jgi:hypothetical protein
MSTAAAMRPDHVDHQVARDLLAVGWPSVAAIECEAVARALLPWSATTFAVIASQTLTTTSSSGSVCRRRSSRPWRR